MMSPNDIFILFALICFHAKIACGVDMIQEEPLAVNENIRVVGTTFASAHGGRDVDIEAPSATRNGDLLVMFLAGSASGKKIPNRPSRGWNLIISEGKEDLNLRAYWKVADIEDLANPFVFASTKDNLFARAETFFRENPFTAETSFFADQWTIEGGKNTFVSVVAIRGIGTSDPIVDADADEDTKDGRKGDAQAPSVDTEEDSIVLTCFVYDDPHVAEVTTRGFEMLLSTDSGTGDGMAIAVAETDGDRTGRIDAVGSSYERGGSDDIAMTISFQSSRASQVPTPSPTIGGNTLFAVRLAPLVNARLDPIVNPGECSSHVHSIFGSANFGETITDEDLLSGATSSNVPINRSLYWAPSMYIFDPETNKYFIVPTYARAYYRFNDEFLETTNPFPLGFRIVIGDASRKIRYQPDERRDDISWTQKGFRRSTNSQDHSSWLEYIEDFGYQTDEDFLEMNLEFPECIAVDLDGSPLLDSPDHRSHMTYTNRRSDPCPPDFPFRIPRLNLEVRYELKKMIEILGEKNVQDPENWYLSTGDTTGAGAHADFIAGWPEDQLASAIQNCRGGDAESGCVLTQFFKNSRAEDRAKRVNLAKEMPDEIISPIDDLIIMPDGACPSPGSSAPTASPSSTAPSSSQSNLPNLKPPITPSNATLTRKCSTEAEKMCRFKCYNRRECKDNVYCMRSCRAKCCS